MAGTADAGKPIAGGGFKRGAGIDVKRGTEPMCQSGNCEVFAEKGAVAAGETG